MTMTEYAKKEIEIACQRERAASEASGEDFDYGSSCYLSAKKAFDSLMEDGHSGMSIQFTRDILMRLIDNKPLTPIEDVEEVWNLSHKDKDGGEVYQCSRMFSLFKHVAADGSIRFSDTNYVTCVDINNGSTWFNGFVSNLIEEQFPITLPYYPNYDHTKYKVYREDFLAFQENGDYDTMGVFYAVDTGTGDRVDIYKYYHEQVGKWVEIDEDEYKRLKRIAILRESALPTVKEKIITPELVFIGGQEE